MLDRGDSRPQTFVKIGTIRWRQILGVNRQKSALGMATMPKRAIVRHVLVFALVIRNCRKDRKSVV